MSVTAVSCYYETPNKHGTQYYEWFNTTLKINCPYVIFASKHIIPILQKYREGLPTHFIAYEIEEFYTYQYKNRIIIHPTHCPSAMLNLIWNEKIHMIKMASDLNIFNSDWYIWIDSGICIFREKAPPNVIIRNIDKLKLLPNNKCIYTASNPYIKENVHINRYYHHISGTFGLHKNFITTFACIYYSALDQLIKHYNIWTDQVVMTHIYKHRPDLFFKLADGYGALVHFLYS